jgi:phosphohistidine phosphatase SixA
LSFKFSHRSKKLGKSNVFKTRLIAFTRLIALHWHWRCWCVFFFKITLHWHCILFIISFVAFYSTMKTVILCRHAESKENVKIRAYKEGIAKLGEWSLPSMDEVSKSLSLLKYNTDQAVSPLGREQIQTMAEKVNSENFLDIFQPQVVCHSPLQRARDTCRGIFGQRDSDLELTSLTEMTPAEIFLFKDRVNVRIREFEDWLDSRSEERIVAVGHSRYFQVMLNAEQVMSNCSILKCTFHPPLAPLAPLDSSSKAVVEKEGEDIINTEPTSRWVVEKVLYTLQEEIDLPKDTQEQDSGSEDTTTG